MTDAKHSDNQDSHAHPGDEAPFGSLEELDAQLARAADAADALVEGAGAATPASTGAPSAINTPAPPSPEHVLTDEFARLEGLVTTAATELGVDTTERQPPSTPPLQLERMSDDPTPAMNVETEDSVGAFPLPTDVASMPAGSPPIAAEADPTAEVRVFDSDAGSVEVSNAAPDVRPNDDAVDAAQTADQEGNTGLDARDDVASRTETATNDPGPADAIAEIGDETRVAQDVQTESPVDPAELEPEPEDVMADAVPGVAETSDGLSELDAALAAGTGADADDRGAPPESNTGSSPDPSASTGGARPEKTAAAVPAFMREFMADGDSGDNESAHGSESQPSPPATRQTSVGPVSTGAKFQVPGKPGVVGTGMLGVVGSVPQPEPSDLEDPGESPDAPTQDTADTTAEPTVRTGLIVKLAPLGFQVLTGVVKVLDRIDRPFARLGPRIRELLGWAALATLGTALVVFVLAWL